MVESIRHQMEEFDCVLSMFPEDGELKYDAQLKDQYENYLSTSVAEAADPPMPRFEYTICFQKFTIGDDQMQPELEIKYPRGYPICDQVDFVVHCAALPRDQMERLQTELLCIATGNDGEIVVLELYQCMADLLSQTREEADKPPAHEEQQSGIADLSLRIPPAPPVLQLGRRAIYFHHIIASNKRRVVKEWALELQLNGFSKIGWPGVVLVEGDERHVQEYVRRLQHLKWKQMVVRGEQTELVPVASSVDEQCRLPKGFCEFAETAMSDAAALCRAVGVEELFLSVMKIYRPATRGVTKDQGDEVPTDKKHKAKKSNKR